MSISCRSLFFLLFVCVTSKSFSSVDEHGYWCGKEMAAGHAFDSQLANALADFFKKEEAKTVVDFGCGLGEYVKTFLTEGLSTKGYDGNPDTPTLSKGVAKVQDLSQKFSLPEMYDWVLSLEVGEHIPKQYEIPFIENLHRHNKKGIILSWAVEGQGGCGHFNEQNNDYIKGVMSKYGYINDLPAEKALRNQATLPWFKNSLMVFRKA